MPTRRTMLGMLAAPAFAPLPAFATPGGRRPGPYMLGADISWIPEDEAAGARYFVDGVQRDPIAILRDAGFNYIRLRMFVNPADPLGYSASAPDKAWCGLEQTIRLGARVKAAGMGLALSFHYSDIWADPEHQFVPAAWRDRDLKGLADAVQAHTRDTLIAMKAGGAPVDMAVIGNEITFGMLWPHGRVKLATPTGNPVTDASHANVGPVGGFDAFAQLLRAGVAGAKQADPDILIQLHNHLGRHWPIVREWTDALIARGVDFDVLGLSCYQQRAQGDWADCFANFTKRYPDKGLLVAEYSSRKRYLNDLVHDLPGERGWGTFIWEPTRHQEALFDLDGKDAGGGPKPDLLAQGMNGAEAPGRTLEAAAAPPPKPSPPKKLGRGGDYQANALLDEYRKMHADYRL